jgi:alkylhydroperoxidase family enzyme
MYLKDLLEPKTTGDVGRFGRVIEACRQQGTQPPGIYYLFAAGPLATPHLCNFMQAIMRGPSELSSGKRELIAAWTSARNDCVF